MKRLTLWESFNYFWTELNICTLSIRERPDDEIQRTFFYDFAIGYPGAFSKYTRDILVDNGIIDNSISEYSELLQSKLLEMEQENTQWNVESLKSSKDWEGVLSLSDKIKNLIREKWNDEEIKSLRGI